MAEERELNEEMNTVTAAHPEISIADDDELTDELAANAVLDAALSAFYSQLKTEFETLQGISEQGNPVRTHLAILDLEDLITTQLETLWYRLENSLAKRGEEFPEQGGNLRKQVIEED